MKSQLRLNRVGSCIWLVVVIAISLSFSGCCTCPPIENWDPDDRPPPPPPPATVHYMPLDDHFISQVGGLAVMEETALFVSDVLNLNRSRINQEFTVAGERIVRTSEVYNNTIVIEPIQKGFLDGLQEGSTLKVDFNRLGTMNLAIPLVIPFAKQGTSERYEIYYPDPERPREIDFGAATYIVTYGGNERNETPYLQFQLEDQTNIR